MRPDSLCYACVDRLQEQLVELPTIKDVLRLYLVRGGGGGQTKVASSSSPTLPFSANVLDLIDLIGDVLDRTANLTIDALTRQPAMQFKLWRGGGWTMDYLDGVDRALAVGIVWRSADGVIGMQPKWQQRLAPCPRCCLRTMGNFAGQDFVSCSSCGGSMSYDEYQRTTLIVANKKEKNESL